MTQITSAAELAAAAQEWYRGYFGSIDVTALHMAFKAGFRLAADQPPRALPSVEEGGQQ